MGQIDISHLCSIDHYQSERATIFPSRASLDWFIRKHRGRLLDHLAIVAPTGRKLISPNAFDRVVVEVGAETATSLAR